MPSLRSPSRRPAVPPAWTAPDARAAGVDEVGRGPLAGPVVAAAVVLALPIAGLADSKTLPAERRVALWRAITAGTRDGRAMVGLGYASVFEIDRLNIRAAALLAMRRAVAALPVPPERALVDGDADPGLPCPTTTVVRGDSRVAAIAAASVVAKVVRDRLMRRLDELYPGYGWGRNAGYGTAVHLDALRRLGPGPQHRLSFRPVREALGG